MKKLLAFLCTAVLCMGMSVSVFAANSPSADNSNQLPVSSTTINGQNVNLEVKTIENALAGLKEEQKQKIQEVVQVVNSGNAAVIVEMQKNLIKEVADVEVAEIRHSKLVDVALPAGTDMPAEGISISFTDTSIKAGMNVVMLHLKADGIWESIPVTVADGTITGIFTSLSPVYYFEVENSGSGQAPYEPTEITFTGEDGRAMRWISSEQNGNISISGTQTSIPAGASFDAKKMYQGADYEEIVKAVVGAKGNVKFEIYDLSLTANGRELTKFNESVTVSMPVSVSLDLQDGQTVTAYYYNNGKLEKCSTVVSDGFVTFYTTHFSTFVYVAESASVAASTPVSSGTVSPKTAENSMSLYIAIFMVAAAGTVYSMKKRTGKSF